MIRRKLNPPLTLLSAALIMLTPLCQPEGLAQTSPLKPSPEVQALLDKAQQANTARQYEQAATLCESAITKARELKDLKGESDALRIRGRVYQITGQSQKAADLYLQSLSLSRQIGDKEGEQIALTKVGFIYVRLGQLSEALDYCRQAVSLARIVGDKDNEAWAADTIADVYSEKGEFEKSMEHRQQALSLFRQVGDKFGEADTLRGLGAAYAVTNQYKKALESWEHELAIHHARADKASEAGALNNIGIIYKETGQYQRALETYQQALVTDRDFGDKLGEGIDLQNIGIVYGDAGQPQQALEYLQKALSILRASGYRKMLPNAFVNIGEVYKDNGLPRQALAYYRQALPIYREIGDRRGEAIALNNIGDSYSDSNNPLEALRFYRQSLPIFRLIRERPGEAATLIGTGITYSKMGHPRKALEYYRQALPVSRSVGDIDGEIKALTRMGDDEASLRNLPSAALHYDRAVALTEQIRANLGAFNESKSSFLGSRLSLYYHTLRVHLRLHQYERAFALAQQTKARSLLDLLASGRVPLSRDVTDEERSQFQQLRSLADSLNQQMVREGVENQVGAKKRFAALQTRLRETERRLQMLSDTLYARHPQLAARTVASTATISTVSRFLSPDTAVLDYVVLSGRQLVLFVIRSGNGGATVKALTMPIDYKQLAEKTSAFRSACSDPRKDYRKASRELYDTLIAPSVRYLKGAKRLVICPDGALWDVPFQALHTGSSHNHFLAEQHEIDYAYSATGAQAALSGKTNRRKPDRTLLALANPDFGSSKRFGDLNDLPGQRPFDTPSRPFDTPSRPFDQPSRSIDVASRTFDSVSRAFDVISRGGHIAALPGTQREADALKKDFPGASIYTGAEAQESIAKREAGKYRYLHFATHGFFNDASPLLSSIVLAQPEPGSKEDGFLTAREIFDMDLSAEMVVLSACNTARGVQRSGDGVIGLTWALFVAGCPTHVVSQWAVDDESTATLMESFYAGIMKGQSKGAALRSAELSLIQNRKSEIGNRKYSHPYYWAPFILMGDWR